MISNRAYSNKKQQRPIAYYMTTNYQAFTIPIKTGVGYDRLNARMTASELFFNASAITYHAKTPFSATAELSLLVIFRLDYLDRDCKHPAIKQQKNDVRYRRKLR